MNTIEEKYPGELWDINDIPVGTILRDWFDEGIRIIIMRGPFHPCVYFGIPLSHPLANHGYDDLPINVHGGLTYAGKGDGKYRPEGLFWYGYDYGHCDDYMFSSEPNIKELYREIGKKWTLKQIVKDTWSGLYDFKKLIKLSESIALRRSGRTE